MFVDSVTENLLVFGEIVSFGQSLCHPCPFLPQLFAGQWVPGFSVYGDELTTVTLPILCECVDDDGVTSRLSLGISSSGMPFGQRSTL